ncbi:MAG TPA: hypothetical protein ENI70_00205 [Candidatus Peregrinibacteria bacterium]|nr:hypothetical protein [Candidatus Peregrinibacteria bacterium]
MAEHSETLGNKEINNDPIKDLMAIVSLIDDSEATSGGNIVRFEGIDCSITMFGSSKEIKEIVGQNREKFGNLLFARIEGSPSGESEELDYEIVSLETLFDIQKEDGVVTIDIGGGKKATEVRFLAETHLSFEFEMLVDDQMISVRIYYEGGGKTKVSFSENTSNYAKVAIRQGLEIVDNQTELVNMTRGPS